MQIMLSFMAQWMAFFRRKFCNLFLIYDSNLDFGCIEAALMSTHISLILAKLRNIIVYQCKLHLPNFQVVYYMSLLMWWDSGEYYQKLFAYHQIMQRWCCNCFVLYDYCLNKIPFIPMWCWLRSETGKPSGWLQKVQYTTPKCIFNRSGITINIQILTLDRHHKKHNNTWASKWHN